MRVQKKVINKIIIPLLALAVGAFINSYYSHHTQSTPQVVTSKAAQPSPTSQVKGVTTEYAKVIEVIDGDTFKIESGEKVRLIGMDTPELHHPTKPVQCFGKEAMEVTKSLIDGKTVRLEKDVSEKDRYGRLLRFVYVPNLPTEIFLNAYLVQEGYAHATTFPPDVSKADLFKKLEREAATANKGLWSSCK